MIRARRPHAFKAVYTVTLHGEKLRTDLRVLNTGDAPFEFTGALHSYFEVLDVGVAKVKGLAGLAYLDKVTGSGDRSSHSNVQALRFMSASAARACLRMS